MEEQEGGGVWNTENTDVKHERENKKRNEWHEEQWMTMGNHDKELLLATTIGWVIMMTANQQATAKAANEGLETAQVNCGKESESKVAKTQWRKTSW